MLKDKIQQDMKDALKSGKSQKRSLLGMAISSIKNKEIEKRGELTDEEIVSVIASEVKKRRDSVEQYQKGGRADLAEQEKKEAEILMAYMPEQMSEDEVRSEVKKAVAQTGAKDIKEMGKVIGAVMAKVKGKADGQLVSRLVKEELSQLAI